MYSNFPYAPPVSRVHSPPPFHHRVPYHPTAGFYSSTSVTAPSPPHTTLHRSEAYPVSYPSPSLPSLPSISTFITGIQHAYYCVSPPHNYPTSHPPAAHLNDISHMPSHAAPPGHAPPPSGISISGPVFSHPQGMCPRFPSPSPHH
ncbi:hypothetical protein K439DRAFT_400153 [Ramaria rubella]|nr:hypothetical protein K439DRAFT_400153 [Ramaria rubella]